MTMKMPSHFLLDTNTISYIVNGNSAAARLRLESLGPNEIACISTITEGEIRYGLYKKPGAKKMHAAVELVLSKVSIFPWGREEAQVFGQLRARLEATGRTLGPMDMLIAAHAISINAILITNDKALLQVKGLLGARRWATDI